MLMNILKFSEVIPRGSNGEVPEIEGRVLKNQPGKYPKDTIREIAFGLYTFKLNGRYEQIAFFFSFISYTEFRPAYNQKKIASKILFHLISEDTRNFFSEHKQENAFREQ